MNKRGSKAIWISLIIIVVLLMITGLIYYFLIGNKVNSGGQTIILENPASGLTAEEAVAQFNESFVLYLLYSIGANKLHNPFLSSDKPKIEIYVSDDGYNAIVDDYIKVGKGEINGEDIRIRTSKEEAVKMMNDKQYVAKSFQEGNSSIELVASKAKLFSKGYLGLYDELTGKSAE